MSSGNLSRLLKQKAELSREEQEKFLDERWASLTNAEQDADVVELSEAAQDEISELSELMGKIKKRLRDPRADNETKQKLEDLLSDVEDQVESYEKLLNTVDDIDEELESRDIDWKDGPGKKKIPLEFDDATYNVTFSAYNNPFNGSGPDASNPFSALEGDIDISNINPSADNPLAGANYQVLDLSAFAHEVSEWRLQPSFGSDNEVGYGSFTLIGESVNGDGNIIIELNNVPIDPEMKNPNVKIILPISSASEAESMPPEFAKLCYHEANTTKSFYYHLYGAELPENFDEVSDQGLNKASTFLAASNAEVKSEAALVLEQMYLSLVDDEVEIGDALTNEVTRLKTLGFNDEIVGEIISLAITTIFVQDYENYEDLVLNNADFLEQIVKAGVKDEDLSPAQMAVIMLLDPTTQGQSVADERFSTEVETDETDDNDEPIYNYTDGKWENHTNNVAALELLKSIVGANRARIGFDIDDKLELETKASARQEIQDEEEENLESHKGYLKNPVMDTSLLFSSGGSTTVQGSGIAAGLGWLTIEDFGGNEEVDPNERAKTLAYAHIRGSRRGYINKGLVDKTMDILLDDSIKTLEDRQDALLSYMTSLDRGYQDDFVYILTSVVAEFDRKLFGALFYDLTPEDMEREALVLDPTKINSFARRMFDVYSYSNSLFGKYEMKVTEAEDYFDALANRGGFRSKGIRESGRTHGLYA